MQRHRHQEFVRFLNAIEAEVPAGKAVHGILDNYAADMCATMAQSARALHIPTSRQHHARGLPAAEGFFAKLTKRRLKRGAFVSVVDLQAAINRLASNPLPNESPSLGPPILTKSSELSGARTKC